MIAGLSLTLLACGAGGEEPASIETPPVPALPPVAPVEPPSSIVDPALPPPAEPALPTPSEPVLPPPEDPPPPPPPVDGQVLFDEDIAKDIRQSIPTDVNIPLGIQATLDVEYLGAFRANAGGESSSICSVSIHELSKGLLAIRPL